MAALRFLPPAVRGLAAVVLLAAAGCAGPPVGADADLAADEDYGACVYYPEFEMFYYPGRHLFCYREGSVWVRRPAPRELAAAAVLASPSVPVPERATPEQHFAALRRQYPPSAAPGRPLAGPAPAPDRYVYYPGLELYYNSARHEYVYRDGRKWVTRPQPPRGTAGALPSAASVPMEFHDAPARHHAAVVKDYPKTWHPAPPPAPAPRPEQKDDHGRKDPKDRKDDRPGGHAN